MHDCILLHCCCAPCAVGVIEALLDASINFHLFFYNPNVFPVEEYERRKAALFQYAGLKKISCIEGDYDVDRYEMFIQGHEREKEGGIRCEKCFFFRLYETAKYAQKAGYPIIATTLAASSRKNIVQIHQQGNCAASFFPNVSFLEYPFRQKDFAKRRSQLIQEYCIYTQKYCGCKYSFLKKPV